MSTQNICFCPEIRKIWILFGWKKTPCQELCRSVYGHGCPCLVSISYNAEVVLCLGCAIVPLAFSQHCPTRNKLPQAKGRALKKKMANFYMESINFFTKRFGHNKGDN